MSLLSAVPLTAPVRRLAPPMGRLAPLMWGLVAAIGLAPVPVASAGTITLQDLVRLHETSARPTAQALLSGPAPAQAAQVAHSSAPAGPSADRAVSPPGLRSVNAAASNPAACPVLLRHSFAPIQGGAAQSLCQYQGKVLLVVNTASQCGYTHQYEGLEALYRKYRAQGLVVVGFPSNDFGGQEPGSNQEIAEFCRTVYGIQFPMFEKASTTRLAENPLYAELIARTGHSPKWNFHKYLIDRTGQRVVSYKSDIEPQGRELTGQIEKLLAEKVPANRT